MPRGFTELEQRRIRARLQQAGRDILGRRGVRKTTIDELASAAGISKGSFYRFYTGKEALALELLAAWERGFHDGIAERFSTHAPQGREACAAQLAAVFLEDFPQQIAVSGIAGLFDPQEMAWLVQRARPADVQRMDEQDLRLFDRLRPLLAAAGVVPCVDDLEIVAALRLLFEAGTGMMGTVQGGPLTAAHYRQGFILLVEGLLQRCFSESGQGAARGDRNE
ncbi:TetR/AcrR family transcriptional regulator [Spirochaeta africana]|uniref:Transcriptional regulator n=1 Tax=Spirochaeta africana (strain ATCC 700263 / DSM 8902 / Z-7692) TaxID=889378 RepID=H9UHX2_SPIAZ|nr:TetR/AcrR family transcriptional regulator [Spirochaeta africana]AFG37115.1 transcriptional regulator [Spirochaeta africana DSM 8902]